jgi:methylenetetrahydrofolate dehydrogenase (NADP+) / methenyltetrahydrofolate cyclohydrolase
MIHDADPRLMLGAPIADALTAQSAASASEFEQYAGRRPHLAAVLVGTDPGSVTYVHMKQRRSATAGIDSSLVQLPETATTEELVSAIARLSADAGVDGILLQHPVPSGIDERAGFEAIASAKDVDGVTLRSLATMALGLAGFHACTPGGILRLLDAYGVELEGRHAVVIGRSPILGLPVGMLLLGRNATVTTCHSRTEDLPEIVRTADLVVAAVGRPNFVKGSWIKPGAVVVDAGYNPGNVGDVAFEEALPVCARLTPVPGGVGPMTIAVLLSQTVDAAWRRWRSSGGQLPT